MKTEPLVIKKKKKLHSNQESFNNTTSLQPKSLFKPIIASTLALSLSSFALANECTSENGAPVICYGTEKGAEGTTKYDPTNIGWNGDTGGSSGFYRPTKQGSSEATDLANQLNINFNGTATESSLTDTFDDNSKAADITANQSVKNITLKFPGKSDGSTLQGIAIGAEGKGTLSVNMENAADAKVVLDLSGTKEGKTAFQGNIEIKNKGNTTGNEVVFEAKLGGNLEGNISLDNTNANFTFDNKASLTGGVFNENSTAIFDFKKDGNITGSLKAIDQGTNIINLGETTNPSNSIVLTSIDAINGSKIYIIKDNTAAISLENLEEKTSAIDFTKAANAFDGILWIKDGVRAINNGVNNIVYKASATILPAAKDPQNLNTQEEAQSYIIGQIIKTDDNSAQLGTAILGNNNIYLDLSANTDFAETSNLTAGIPDITATSFQSTIKGHIVNNVGEINNIFIKGGSGKTAESKPSTKIGITGNIITNGGNNNIILEDSIWLSSAIIKKDASDLKQSSIARANSGNLTNNNGKINIVLRGSNAALSDAGTPIFNITTKGKAETNLVAQGYTNLGANVSYTSSSTTNLILAGSKQGDDSFTAEQATDTSNANAKVLGATYQDGVKLVLQDQTIKDSNGMDVSLIETYGNLFKPNQAKLSITDATNLAQIANEAAKVAEAEAQAAANAAQEAADKAKTAKMESETKAAEKAEAIQSAELAEIAAQEAKTAKEEAERAAQTAKTAKEEAIQKVTEAQITKIEKTELAQKAAETLENTKTTLEAAKTALEDAKQKAAEITEVGDAKTAAEAEVVKKTEEVKTAEDAKTKAETAATIAEADKTAAEQAAVTAEADKAKAEEEAKNAQAKAEEEADKAKAAEERVLHTKAEADEAEQIAIEAEKAAQTAQAEADEATKNAQASSEMAKAAQAEAEEANYVLESINTSDAPSNTKEALFTFTSKREVLSGSGTDGFKDTITIDGLFAGNIVALERSTSNTNKTAVLDVTLKSNSIFFGGFDLSNVKKEEVTGSTDISLTMEKGSKFFTNRSTSLQNLNIKDAQINLEEALKNNFAQSNTVIDLGSYGNDNNTLITRENFNLLSVGSTQDSQPNVGLSGNNALFRVYANTNANQDNATLDGAKTTTDPNNYGHVYSDRIIIDSIKDNADSTPLTEYIQVLYDINTDTSKITHQKGGTATAGNIAVFTVKNDTTESKPLVDLKTADAIQGFDRLKTNLTTEATDRFGKVNESTNGYTTYFINSVESKGASLANQQATAAAFTNNYELYLANMNSLNKRMGELRNNANAQGVWARVFNGMQTSKFSLETKSLYTTFQAGYDYAFGMEGANNYLGFAVSYINSTTKTKNILDIDNSLRGLKSAANSGVEFAIYNAYVQDGASSDTGFKNGLYTDSILKFSFMKNNLELTGHAENYNINNLAITFSQEVGYRFLLGKYKAFYIDPQAEVALGYLDQSELNQKLGTAFLNGVQDSIFTLRGRVGSSFGYKFDQLTQDKGFKSQVYVGTYFTGDYISGGSITLVSNLGSKTPLNSLSSTGRFVMNLGTNFTIKDHHRIYFDFERSFGGKIITNYQVNLGYRYSFGENKKYAPLTTKLTSEIKKASKKKEEVKTEGQTTEAPQQ